MLHCKNTQVSYNNLFNDNQDSEINQDTLLFHFVDRNDMAYLQDLEQFEEEEEGENE